MIYLTHTRLMDESERTVHDRAAQGDDTERRICRRLLSDQPRYRLWEVRHDRRMGTVASERRRDLQILSLRAAALEQVHCTALVRYLREHNVTGAARDRTLSEFYGIIDPRDAAIAAHRSYLIAASSEVCAHELLELAGDTRGSALVQTYETSHAQFFSLFCDRARARRERKPYLLSSLIPEARAHAEGLRRRILAGVLLPRTVAIGKARTRPIVESSDGVALPTRPPGHQDR